MTVEKFIDWLKKAKDIDRAEIEFWLDDKMLEIESIGQFGIVPDVTVCLKEMKDVPILTPVTSFRRDKEKMIKKTVKKINKNLKNEKK